MYTAYAQDAVGKCTCDGPRSQLAIPVTKGTKCLHTPCYERAIIGGLCLRYRAITGRAFNVDDKIQIEDVPGCRWENKGLKLSMDWLVQLLRPGTVYTIGVTRSKVLW